MPGRRSGRWRSRSRKKLNARNFFDHIGGPSQGKDPFTRTQAGFAIGGPIGNGRTQFFSGLEADIINASSEQHFSTPRIADRRFLGLPRFRVLQPGVIFGDNRDLRASLDTTLGTTPLGRNVLSFYPAPNDPGGPFGENTFTEVLPAGGRGAIFSFKLTRRVANNSALDARYNFTDDLTTIPSVNRAIRSTIESDIRTQNLAIVFDTEVTDRLFNLARFSFGRTRLSFSQTAKNPFVFSQSSVEAAPPVTAIPSTTGPIGELAIEPYSPVGVNAYTFPQRRANNTFQYADSLSWTRGPHALKFGIDIRRVQLNSVLDRNYRPQVVYGNAILRTGTLELEDDPSNPFKFFPDDSIDLLSGLQMATLGLPSSIFQTVSVGTPNSTIGLRFTEQNLFFNDNWRVRSNLNVDYGLRYERNTVPREVNSRIEQALSLKDLPSPGGSRADTPQRSAAFSAAVAAYERVLAGRTRIYEPDGNNFGPHIGFAWNPWSDGRTAVRAGYGIYYDAILGSAVTQSRNVFPNEVPVNVEPAFLGFDMFVLNNPSTLVIRDGSGGSSIPEIPFIRPGTLNQLGGSRVDSIALLGQLFLQNVGGGGLAFTLPEKNLRTPYAQQWHVTLEREIWSGYLVSAAYVGTKGTKLMRLATPNLGPNVTPSILLATRFQLPSGAPIVSPPTVAASCRLQPDQTCSRQPDRPIRSLGAYQEFQDSAASNYHALQFEARKRYDDRFQFTAAYTWSHAIDDVSDVLAIAGAPGVAQSSRNLRLERGNAGFDVRHRFAASLIWELPFSRNSRSPAIRLLSGWQVGCVFQAHTGQPFTLNVPVDANFDGNLSDRASTTDGLIQFGGHGPRRIALEPGRQLTDFFIFGRDGAVGRNTVRGDGLINLDAAIRRSFGSRERNFLDLGIEVFNVMNRSNFGLPIRVIGAPGFGSAVETGLPARRIQLSLKYHLR